MRILFFNPFNGISGAQNALWTLLPHAEKHGHVVAMYWNGGMPQIGLQGRDAIRSFSPPLVNSRIIRRLPSVGAQLRKLHLRLIQRTFEADVWYLNTLHMPDVAALAVKLGVPYIVHFHDLTMMYQHVRYDELRNMIKEAALLIGCSSKVCEQLGTLGGRTIKRLYEWIDVEHVRPARERRAEFRAQLGASDSTFIWAMSGTIDYRKGTDIFAELAHSLRDTDMMFLWIGGGANTGYRYYLDQLLRARALNNCKFIGHREADYLDWLACADGLVLTSREDPFPLVMIEAAALSLPIVSFESGGVSEFMRPGMGTLLRAGDVLGMAAAMEQIANGSTSCDPRVSRARAADFDVRIVSRAWERIISGLDVSVVSPEREDIQL